MSRAGALIALILMLALGGCYGSGIKEIEPPSPMDQGRIDEIRATTKHRGYWFGRSSNGLKVRSVARSSAGITFEYGTPRCDTSGCGAELLVSTRSKRFADYDGVTTKPCWRRLGRAWMEGCKGYFVIVYTGDLEIRIEALSENGEPHISSLMPINRATARILERPQRLRCGVVRRYPRVVQRSVPADLRPLQCRGLPSR